MERMKLSVVILSKNEEKIIGRCLESVKWADEMIVVDGFSTDQTCVIASGYGAKVVQHKFEGDFGEERNIGIDNSKGDWVLQLDCDEVVTEGFKSELMKILEGQRPEYVSYKFLRKNFFLGRFMRWGGWYHYSHHLFKRGFARYKGRVHHDLLVNGKTGVLNAEVEHYPFQSLSQLVERQNRYTDLESREIYELKGVLSKKEIGYNLKVKPVKLFWKFYVKKRGYREGMHGFVFSLLFAWTHFIKWAKYWEIVREKQIEGASR
ncbi:MAG: glycosyltransferase family 2 protein [Candidatus Omnitrophica bacterium]|nr:glycosyltransferase family 2 protein [Candidatus Omnitrophota bacterium]